MGYKFTIDKEFHFEAGHRVWAQKLEHEHLSIETECCCKHLHGHSYTVKVFLGANELNSSQMVIDFKNLNFMKQFLDTTLDHKFIIDINDPNFDLITGIADDANLTKNFIIGILENARYVNLGATAKSSKPNVQLHRDSFVIVNFVPTSENICKFLKEYAQERIGNIATVTAVELWETKKSHARYED